MIFRLQIDEPEGVSKEILLSTFDYDKKLRHYLKKPEKTSASQIVDE